MRQVVHRIAERRRSGMGKPASPVVSQEDEPRRHLAKRNRLSSTVIGQGSGSTSVRLTDGNHARLLGYGGSRTTTPGTAPSGPDQRHRGRLGEGVPISAPPQSAVAGLCRLCWHHVGSVAIVARGR